MNRIRSWLGVASDGWILRRALLTSLVVGSVLTAINHGADLLAGRIGSALVVQTLLTFLVPFLVTVISGVAAIRAQRRDGAQAYLLLEREVEAINKFPDQNPNPVMRLARDGRLLYGNEASSPIIAALRLEVGSQMAPDLASRLWAIASGPASSPVEVVSGWQTFSVLPIFVPELDVLNLYGTDITAAKVVERFPDRNPNPVLRMSEDGTLIYANDASTPITAGLHLKVGDALPRELLERLRRGLRREGPEPVEVGLEGRTFALVPVSIPEFDFTNIYGTDITALKALDKFPDQNPNPVLRVTRDGRLAYANPASRPVKMALGVDIGESLPAEFFARVQASLAAEASHVLEVQGDGRTFELLVVSVFEFGFINLYGTDVTAAREIAMANRENERLLLNILPASIAERLRAGEMVIADRFEEMTVLFADVVGFTQLSTVMAPGAVVEILNGVFSIFDRLADRYDLEKIKTIGDAYMVVGGLKPGENHHAERVADMALDIVDEVSRFRSSAGHELQIRVGIQIGPAVAGVIGIKKFIYDVWGDTVNTASRMESHGLPGRVQVTEATYQRLLSAFEFEPRGVIDVRGKGPMATYFLVGRRAAPLQVALASGDATPDDR